MADWFKVDFFLRHIRRGVIIFSVALAAGAFFVVRAGSPLTADGIVRLEEFYAFAAVAFLYVALLASPLISAFPKLPVSVRAVYVKSRRALGVSAFLFGLLHGSIAFFVLLGGFGGLVNLPSQYLFPVSLGFTVLVILAALAATSFDYAVRALGRKWKMLHRLVYGVAVLVLIHALILGAHFNPSGFLALVFYFAAAVLLALETLRMYKIYIKIKK